MNLKKAHKLQKAVNKAQNKVLNELAKQGAHIPDEMYELLNNQMHITALMKRAINQKTK